MVEIIDSTKELKKITGMKMKKKDAQMILDYLEGHDYRLANENGQLVRIDLCDNYKSEKYSIDEVIDLVCDWNYDLRTIAEENLEKAENKKQEKKIKKYISGLLHDEKRLDNLFRKTCYAR